MTQVKPELDAEFLTYSAEVVTRYFENAPLPDGTNETNREHIRRKEAACQEIRQKLAEGTLSEVEQRQRNWHAEDIAQSAIYALFSTIKRKPKRFK